MGKPKKKSDKCDTLTKALLALTAALNLIKALVDLIDRLLK